MLLICSQDRGVGAAAVETEGEIQGGRSEWP